jgi:gliding motility-associated-like protein
VAAIPLYAQQPNDNCSFPEQLCFGSTLTVNNNGATADALPVTCFTSVNTVWVSFYTNQSGGDVEININSSICQSVNIGAAILLGDCPSSNFSQLDCATGTAGTVNLSANNLPALTQYFLVLNSESGGTSVGCNFSLSITGSGVETSFTSNITDAVCFQSLGSISLANEDFGPGPYSYTLDGRTQNNSTFNDLSVDDYTLTVENQVGCAYPINFFVNGLNNTVEVDAGDDKFIVGGSSATLEVTGNGVAYFWIPDQFIDDVNSASPIVSPIATTTYTVMAFSPEKCIKMDQVTVNVLPQIYIPNAFTPNADGTNDTWQIFNIDQYPESEVVVFNKWGQRVYKTTGYGPMNEWDGRSGNSDLPTSTYFYIINLNAKTDNPESEIFRGSVTIIR